MKADLSWPAAYDDSCYTSCKQSIDSLTAYSLAVDSLSATTADKHSRPGIHLHSYSASEMIYASFHSVSGRIIGTSDSDLRR